MSHPILSILSENRETLNVHLIGVAGSGMSGLALLCMELGHRVSGSDRVTTEETERMEGLGLEFTSPHGATDVEGAHLVCYSSAIKPGNPAYDAAVAADIPLVRRAELLAAIMQMKQGLVVAGTHGKTTTSALAAHVLRIGGLHPSHYVGAEIPILGSNAKWSGEGDVFVAEGDESDGTLVSFHPARSILLNIEAEHLDHYSGLDELKEVFRTLVAQTSGEVIYCGEDPVATELGSETPDGRGLSYGWSEEHDFRAEVLESGPTSSRFKVFEKGTLLGEVTLGIPGEHNVLNSLAAIAVARLLGLPIEKIGEALASFRGARRRFEVKHLGNDFTVIDDYGHHPTEIKATLATARRLGASRLVCLFQPHRYSRTQLLKEEFGVAFGDADLVIVTDVYPASERPLPGVSGETIVDAVREAGGPEIQSAPTLEEARLLAGSLLREGDLLITLGAGNIHEVATAMGHDLEVVEGLKEHLDGESAKIRLYEPMRRHCTMKVGGPAQFWVEPETVTAFSRVLEFFRSKAAPVRVIGRGSNLLVRDGGISGAVVHPAQGDFTEIRVEGETITAGTGVRFKKLTAAARTAGLGGFEWMEGIPGSVGGGIRMNAGAMGVETFDQVVSVRFLDAHGDLQEKSVDAIDFSYRSVPEFTDNYVVSVVFKGTPLSVEKIDELLETSRSKRKSSQPIAASAGCIFKNPDAVPAGKLVEELGFKDSAHGGARVSTVHGNFIVNEESATAADVLALIESIQEKAHEERGIDLHTEVSIIGDATLSY